MATTYTATAPDLLTDEELTDEDAVPEVRIPMTYDEYQAWLGVEEHHRGEWVDGEVIVFVSVTPRHAEIVAFLIGIFGNYLDLRRVGRVFASEAEMRGQERAARRPDVAVVLHRHRDRVTEQRILGAADLAVEVISPESVRRDRVDKRVEYAEAGVPEYWIVDPRRHRERVDLLVLEPDGRYREAEADAEGRVHSAVLPGVWVDPAWLTMPELPSVVRLGTAMAEAGDALAAGDR